MAVIAQRASLSTFHHQFGSHINEVDSRAGETPHRFIIAAPSPEFVPHGFIRNRAHEDQAPAATLLKPLEPLTHHVKDRLRAVFCCVLQVGIRAPATGCGRQLKERVVGGEGKEAEVD